MAPAPRHPRRAYDSDGNMIPPPTVGGERAKDYRTILAHCHLCHRSSAVNLSFFADELAIPDIQPRLRCSVCGSKERITIMVNLHEHYAIVDKHLRDGS